MSDQAITHSDSGLPASISLGAGVQSSTMLLMAARGEFDGKIPKLAIFADTGWEPPAVYEHLDWLTEEVADVIPVIRVSEGNLRDDLFEALDSGRKWPGVPVHIVGDRGVGMLGRQCTRAYKLDPIRHELGRRGYGPKNRVEAWQGISVDEVQRMKPSRTKWQVSRFPLIERRLSRHDCLRWFKSNYPGRELTKSACVGCPYHNTAGWQAIKRDPALWADAVEVDETMRAHGIQSLEGETETFLHYSRRPLTEVDLSTPEERGQLNLVDAADEAALDPEGFGDECEGMCGV